MSNLIPPNEDTDYLKKLVENIMKEKLEQLRKAGWDIGIEILSSVLNETVNPENVFWYYEDDGYGGTFAYLAVVYKGRHYGIELEDIFHLLTWESHSVVVKRFEQCAWRDNPLDGLADKEYKYKMKKE